MSLAAIVLTGGLGRRMGRPKAGVELNGETLLQRAVTIVRDAGCAPIIAAAEGDEGPLAALAQPLDALDADAVILLACDLPLAGPAVARLAGLPAGAAVAVDPDGREQPLCSRWPVAVVRAEVLRLVASGERRMSALVDAIDPELVLASAEELLNVNTPEDLARVRLLFEN